MTDLKVRQTTSKQKLFSSARSTSEPAAASEEPAGVPQPKNTLRRSKSGRVKVMSRNRSLVSTYDFNNKQDAVPEEHVREDKDKKKRDIDAEMLRRIARMWTEEHQENAH